MFHRKASGLTANPQAEDRRERTECRHQRRVIGACRGCANTDDLEHSVWVTMMRDRPEQLKLLLSEDGSLWVHCDDAEQAYLNTGMDAIFGRECLGGTIIWQSSHLEQ